MSIVICSVLLLLSVVGKEPPPSLVTPHGADLPTSAPSEDQWVGQRCNGPGTLNKGVELGAGQALRAG